MKSRFKGGPADLLLKTIFTYIYSTEQQQSGGQAHRVDGSQQEGDEEEHDAPLHWEDRK